MTIENLGNLTLRINGPDVEKYAESNFTLFNVPYDNTISIYFITKINFDLSAELLDNKSPYAIIIHNPGDCLQTREIDSFEVTVPKDGYYKVISLVIPTLSYVKYNLGYIEGTEVRDNLNTTIIAADVSEYGDVCFKILTHEQDKENSPYSHKWLEWEDISLSSVLDLVDELNQYGNLDETTVKRYELDTFVMDILYKCYINRASDLLNLYSGDAGFCSGNSLCNDSLGKYKSEIQIRDYLWMAVNIIKYCILNRQYLKALKILNCVTTCAGICSDVTISPNNTKSLGGCGCNKRN